MKKKQDEIIRAIAIGIVTVVVLGILIAIAMWYRSCSKLLDSL